MSTDLIKQNANDVIHTVWRNSIASSVKLNLPSIRATKGIALGSDIICEFPENQICGTIKDFLFRHHFWDNNDKDGTQHVNFRHFMWISILQISKSNVGAIGAKKYFKCVINAISKKQHDIDPRTVVNCASSSKRYASMCLIRQTAGWTL